MTRTKKRGNAANKSNKSTPAKQVPEFTVIELLHQSAALISSTEYESAKLICIKAVELAELNQDVKGMMESLEILGTIELELGELDNAREVSFFSIFTNCFFVSISNGRYYFVVKVRC